MKYIILCCMIILGGFVFFQYGLNSDTAFSSTSQSPDELPSPLMVCGDTETDDPEFSQSLMPPPHEPIENIHAGTIRPGDTASRILSPWLSSAQIHGIALATKEVFDLRKIRAGRDYRVITTDNSFARLEYSIDNSHFLAVDLDEEGFHASVHSMAYDIYPATVHGVIETTLSDAMKSSEDITLAIRLNNLFGWEIDFSRDLRKGDTFSVLVERRYHNDEFQGYGNIIAAKIINRGRVHDAYRFEYEDGHADFFNSQGQNIKRFFLKSPVPFGRITSGFTLSRYHPILKEYRPHYGVDYAAPTGTPIYAAGSGTVIQATQNAGSGRFVRIRHGNGYETAYLHMSRFARGMRAGKKVDQGEVIGYIGQSGLATGPHVCFRMTHNGTPVDPTKVDSPRAKELPEDRKQDFAALVANLQPQLTIHYAQADAGDPGPQAENKSPM
ncbi:peptidoglycan DD-metalloendopeptidase family protein [Desulfobotulus sp. H1]|uniref:Peptidoglycan DD-metalloendopeptidase family protein n=1 Tax=Desulfobotulus pelophilus TaxID=2823377 RepID=A0ABT3NCT9_9BACT|nr:peptidoglycan DD-metalloendopeptidase family protein [Desulfobotulus pelophilus]MCW7755288.1 peptidoglycan DD-metalloendopeptidase family protein [Desulfobotulus pelophilus]